MMTSDSNQVTVWFVAVTIRASLCSLNSLSECVAVSHLNNYRPERSCGKVMFLHLSVILSTGGEENPLNRHPSVDPPEQTPHEHTPYETATAADGTNPTGMHSCYDDLSVCVSLL